MEGIKSLLNPFKCVFKLRVLIRFALKVRVAQDKECTVFWFK